MKSLIFYTITFSLIFSLKTFCQPAITATNTGNIIISGQSLIEVEPTSYILEITIAESFTKSPNSEFQVIDIYIDSIELMLKEKVTELGFASNDIKSVSINTAFNNNYNNVNSELLVTEVFILPVKTYEDLTKLTKGLRFYGLQEIKIKKLFDKDKIEIQNQLYSEALNDAKNIAVDLLTSINLKPSGGFNILFIDPMESPFRNITICCGGYASEFDMLNQIKRTETISTSFNFTFEMTH